MGIKSAHPSRGAATKPAAAATGLVYSTEAGRMCPDCRAPLAQCRCRAAKSIAAPAFSDGIVRVSHETKGRKGKGVTLVRGLGLDAEALAALGRQLRSACGSGGTVKEGVIEIQGDHRDLVIVTLARLGHAAKRAGG